MSNVDEFLEHFGVMGMRWGVRRDPKTGVRPIAKALDESKFGDAARANAEGHISRKYRKKDQKWQKNIYTVNSAMTIHNAVADKMNNGGLERLNGQKKYDKLNAFDEPNSSLTKAYFREYEALNEKFTSEAVKEVHGISPSGRYKAELDTSGEDWKVKISSRKGSAVHAAGVVLPDLIIEANHDEKGHITSSRMVKSSMGQSDISVEEFIAHYGVLGMRWGVRRKGRGVQISEDAAVKIKTIDKAKRHSTNALTNQELKDVNNRLNMEQQFHNLKPKGPLAIGVSFVKDLLGLGKTLNEVNSFVNSPAGETMRESFNKKKKGNSTSTSKEFLL